MLTQEETQALLALLNRVSLNGAEAETVVMLKQKLRSLLESGNSSQVKNEKTSK